MRLRDYADILEKNIPNMDISIKSTTANNRSVSEILNFKEAIDALETLYENNFFKKDISNLRGFSDIYYSGLPRIIVENNVAANFNTLLNKVKNQSNELLNVLNNVVPAQPKNSISVKLPDFNTLHELQTFTKDLNTVLSQSLVNPYSEGEVTLTNFDTGSSWFDISLGNPYALAVFASMLGLALKTTKEIMRIRLMGEQIESMKNQNQATEITNEAMKEIKDSLKSQINQLNRASALQVIEESEVEIDSDGKEEYIKRLSHSIGTLGELLIKGTEIYPALNSSDNIKAAFPKPQKFEGFLSSIKQLSPSSSGSDNE